MKDLKLIAKRGLADLKQKQSLPLEAKVQMTKRRIREWVEYWEEKGHDCHVSFSGGKDSTVLLHMVREMYPDTKGVFCNTGLEFPEIVKFVKTIDNIVILKPKKNFKRVLEEDGYPVVSKSVSRYINDVQKSHEGNKATVNLRMTGYTRAGNYVQSMKIPEKWKYLIDAPFKISDKCCDFFKKNPIIAYQKKTGEIPIIGNMTHESNRRERDYIKHSCNQYDTAKPISKPMSFWLENDVLKYIKKNDIEICEIYGEIIQTDLFGEEFETTGEKRTGCIFCMYGSHMEKDENNRFLRLQKTHPTLHKYCIEKLGLGHILDLVGVKHTAEVAKMCCSQ